MSRKPEALWDRGAQFINDGRSHADVDLIDAGLALLRRAEQALTGPDRALVRYNIGAGLLLRFRIDGDLDTLTSSVAALDDALAAATEGHPRHREFAAVAGIAYRELYLCTQRSQLLGISADLLRAALNDATPGQLEWVRHLFDYLATLLLTCEHIGDVAVFDEATAVIKTALAGGWVPEPQRERLLDTLSGVLLVRGERYDDLTALRQSISLARKRLPRTGAGPAEVESRLGAALLVHHRLTGDKADLDEAIERLRLVRAEYGNGNPHVGSPLGNALLERGDPGDLDEVIEILEEALAAPAPQPAPASAMALSSLATALLTRYLERESDEDLVAAVQMSRDAVRLMPEDHARRPMVLATLGRTLVDQCRSGGGYELLTEAINLLEHAMDITPQEHGYRAGFLLSLVAARALRGQLAGDGDVLETALAEAREIATAVRAGKVEDLWQLCQLGGILVSLYRHAGTVEMLTDALTVLTKAMDICPPDRPVRASIVGILAQASSAHFKITGDVAALDTAIQIARTQPPPIGRTRGWYLSSIGSLFVTRAEALGTVGAVDEALTTERAALDAAAPVSIDRGDCLFNVGSLLLSRYQVAGDLRDLQEAQRHLREAATSPSTAPYSRVSAGALWGRAAALADDWDGALLGFTTALEHLPVLVTRDLSRVDRERHLAEFPDLACDATAVALHRGDPELGLSLLEHGRGVLLSQSLELRDEINELHQHAPDLAQELVELRKRLDADTHIVDTNAHARRQAMRSRTTAAHQLTSVLARIRSRPGLQRWGLPPQIEDLMNVAADGAIVMINVSQYRSDAIILTTTGIHAVSLPEISPDVLRLRVVEFLETLDGLADSSRSMAEKIVLGKQFRQTMTWLWDTITEPVLDSLGITDEPNDEHAWPRIWWCPTGLLNFLPLHAAGRFSGHSGQPNAIDHVISSYTPTIRALRYVRRPRNASPPRPRLFVAVAQAPGVPPLNGVDAEAHLLAEDQSAQALVLTGHDARRQRVLDELHHHTWAHFSCHSLVYVDRPSASSLFLDDEPLTVLDISRLHLDDAHLAFLSACSTMRGGPTLPDEAIHITGAFQLAGYRHTIGTLWPIGDRTAVEIARQTYTAINTDSTVATALHTALRHVKRTAELSPWIWASHVHTGP